MSTADLASAGRPPTGGGHPPSNLQHSNHSNAPQPGPFGLPPRFSPSGHPMNRGPQYGPNGPFPESSRSGTPSGNLRNAAGPSDQHFQNQAPAIAAPRPVPPFPRFTSPQPYENFGRSPSPSKRSAGPFNSGFGRDARERWASIGQVQESGGSAATFGGSHDTPLHRPQSGQPPFAGPPSAGAAQDPFFGYGDFFGPPGPGNGPSGGANREFSPTNPNAPSGDRGFGQAQHPEDMRFEPGRFGHHSGDPAGFSGGYPSANGSAGPLNDAGSMPPGLAPGGMSPRSMMMFHNHQMHAQQGGVPGHPSYASGANHSSQGAGAHSLGSGLMSNSGQPAEEITTVFIVGFPDDMTERELANMFLFAKGFEASTLKIPAGGPTPGSGAALQREMGGVNGALGAGGPYSAVNMAGSNMYDTASSGGWDEHALNAALSRAGPSDPFSLASMGNALGSIGSASGGGPANAAGKIKQIIGFAKFRTRAEALEARDALNGKKIDAERGCVLKTEMAKKNLHTKQKPVLPGPSGHLEGPFGGTIPQGPGSMFHHPSSDRDSMRQAGNGPGPLSGPHPSSFPSSAAPAFESFARGPSSALPGMISPSGGEGSYGSDVYTRSAARGGLEPGFGSSSGIKTPGESSRSAAGDPWSSRGPLDYFGPSSEGKRGGDESSQPHSASEKQSFASSQQQQTGPRGPDWSAVGSPPRGGFSTKTAFGADASSRSAISPSKQSTSSGSSTSNTNHFHPHSHTYGKEDFGMGEPMTTITTPTTSRGESSRRGTRSTTSGGSFSGSPTKAGLTEKSMTASSSQASTSPSFALETPQSSNSLGSAQAAGSQGEAGGISNDQQNPGAFAPRFGGLRLDSSQGGSAPGNAMHDKPTGAGADSSGPKSPGDLPSPTSRSFSIDQNPPGNTLFVGNLPSNSSASSSASLEDQLRQRFSACTGYRQLSFRVKNNGPMCFVEFDDVQNAARALAEVNGDTMNGAVKSGGLRLSFSKNPLFRNSCSANNATIGGASTPTSSTPTPAVSAGPQYVSLGGLGENMRKQPTATPATATGPGASSAGTKNGITPSAPSVDPIDSINTLEDSAYRDGFGAGSAHGKLHGTFEGRQLGREKGFEIWDEVGFYEGTARFWKGVLAKQVESVPTHMRSRKQMKQLQHLNGLETLIAAFPTKNRSGTQPEPSPASLLANASDAAGRRASDGSVEGGDDAEGQGEDTPGDQEDPESLSKLDMSALLERIRARYKVVCASLGIPARGLDPNSAGTVGEGAQTFDATKHIVAAGGDGTATPTGAGPTNGNKNTAVVGGKVVDTTRLRF